MNTFKDILLRTSLSHLSHIIRDDSKTPIINHETFSTREEIAYQKLMENLNKIYTDDLLYNVEAYINEYTSEISEIYFNIGIKTGARLLTQLLNNEEKDF